MAGSRHAGRLKAAGSRRPAQGGAGSRRPAQGGRLKAAGSRRRAQAGWLKARVATLACLTPVSRVLTSPIPNTPAASPLGVTLTAQQRRLAGLQPTDSLQARGPEAAKTVAPLRHSRHTAGLIASTGHATRRAGQASSPGSHAHPRRKWQPTPRTHPNMLQHTHPHSLTLSLSLYNSGSQPLRSDIKKYANIDSNIFIT